MAIPAAAVAKKNSQLHEQKQYHEFFCALVRFLRSG